MLGRRFESAGTRAVAAQGAAADEWQDLAVFHRQRAELAESQLAEERLKATLKDEEHRKMIQGLENRLREAGEVVRRPGQPVVRPVHEREQA